MTVRRPGESSLDFRRRVLDPVSPTFCAAKWYNATLWLGSGQTASCHHPPPHEIPRAALERDPGALHNTAHKIEARRQMLAGEKPRECEYCWKIEGVGAISDRVGQSDFHAAEDLAAIAGASADTPVTPRVLEIAFDRRCNMACSYCNAGYSTLWARDIRRNGAYRGLRSDGAGAYRHDGAWADRHEKDERNPYVDAFHAWWPRVREKLVELRITGGEPLVSPHFWKFMELLAAEGAPANFLFSINSNLSHSPEVFERFFELAGSVGNLGLYTSCEAKGAQAEYLRDGLDYARFFRNLDTILAGRRVGRVQIMSTVTALALFSLTDFLDDLLGLKAKYGTYLPSVSFNILRFPSFMSPSVLPEELRLERAEHIERWLARQEGGGLLWHAEVDGLRRIVAYLREIEAPHDRASSLEVRQRDFRAFYTQYDSRRGKDFARVFPRAVTDWYAGLPLADLGEAPELIDGNAADGYHAGAGPAAGASDV